MEPSKKKKKKKINTNTGNLLQKFPNTGEAVGNKGTCCIIVLSTSVLERGCHDHESMVVVITYYIQYVIPTN